MMPHRPLRALLAAAIVAIALPAQADPLAAAATDIYSDPQMDIAARWEAIAAAGWQPIADAAVRDAIARTYVRHDGVTMLQLAGADLDALVDRLAPTLVDAFGTDKITPLAHPGTDTYLIASALDGTQPYFDCWMLLSGPEAARSALVDRGTAAPFFTAGTSDFRGNRSFFVLNRDLNERGWTGLWGPQSGMFSVLPDLADAPPSGILACPALFKFRSIQRASTG